EYINYKDLPPGANILRSKIKRGPGGEFLKFKGRMVAMGYTQVEGVDYIDTFASVMTTKSFRILLSFYNNFSNLFFEHWDVKNAFVNAPLKEEIFVKQVPGFEKKGQENKILKLKKA